MEQKMTTVIAIANYGTYQVVCNLLYLVYVFVRPWYSYLVLGTTTVQLQHASMPHVMPPTSYQVQYLVDPTLS